MKRIFKNKNQKTNKQKQAFTLVEIVVVLAIVSVLVALTVTTTLTSEKTKLRKISSYSSYFYTNIQSIYQYILLNKVRNNTLENLEDENADKKIDSQDLAQLFATQGEGEVIIPQEENNTDGSGSNADGTNQGGNGSTGGADATNPGGTEGTQGGGDGTAGGTEGENPGGTGGNTGNDSAGGAGDANDKNQNTQENAITYILPGANCKRLLIQSGSPIAPVAQEMVCVEFPSNIIAGFKYDNTCSLTVPTKEYLTADEINKIINEKKYKTNSREVTKACGAIIYGFDKGTGEFGKDLFAIPLGKRTIK